MLGIHGMRSPNYQNPVNWDAPLNRGLLAWWRVLPMRFGGRAWTDIAGGDVASFSAMGTTSATSGWAATAYPGAWGEVRCPGASGFLTVPSSTALNLVGSSTVTVVAKNRVTGNQITAPIGKNMTTGTFPGWQIGFAADANLGAVGQRFVGCVRQSDTSERGQVSTANVVDTAYHHWSLVANQSANTLRLYRDGIVLPSTNTLATGAWPDPSGTQPVTLGQDGWGDYFAGALVDVRLWTRALTDSEIFAVYVASATGYRHELLWQTWPLALGLAARKAPPPPRRAWRVFRRAA